ncbi:hypothetical protein IQ07DRAFT_638728 [Pyrenochaeta sp. DS3sAY3a]|nr:hypothetical protein IQ07DRAFT_638728 [Pyrenochaeta sp. DS3sAY3a]
MSSKSSIGSTQEQISALTEPLQLISTLNPVPSLSRVQDIGQSQSNPVSPQTSLPDELEPFPDLGNAFTCFFDGEAEKDVHDAYMLHCIEHCRHRVCHSRAALSYLSSLPELERCKCHATSHLLPSELEKRRIDKVSMDNVKEARDLFKTTNGKETITISLRAAMFLVNRLRELKVIDFETPLLKSSPFQPSDLYSRQDYRKAIESTEYIIKGIFKYFEISLSHRPRHSVEMKVRDLLRDMKNCSQLDVDKWLSQWFSARRVGTITLAERTQQKDPLLAGAQVVVQHTERLILEVIAVLVWWDRREARARSKAAETA